MAQKIIKIGSSIGVTLPSPLLEHLELSVGDAIELQKHDDGILITPAQPDSKSVNRELLHWAEDAINRYRPALDALKDK